MVAPSEELKRSLTSLRFKIISVAFFIKPGDAMMWRGPMAGGALKQFILESDWGELDFLLFDLYTSQGHGKVKFHGGGTYGQNLLLELLLRKRDDLNITIIMGKGSVNSNLRRVLDDINPETIQQGSGDGERLPQTGESYSPIQV